MWKKVLWLIAGILAITLIVSGVMTAVNADDAQAGGQPPARHGGPGGPGGFGAMFSDNLTARVATILGIDKSKLTDAYKQAGKELASERTDTMFAKWVADGKLTQEQADAYKAWMASRPSDIPMFFGSDNTTRNNEMLGKLLADGKITQAQADSITAWLAAKPAVSLPKPERPANAPANANKDNTRVRPSPTDMLDRLLKDGKITQATYDAYKAWFAAKPSADLPGFGGPQGGAPCPPPAPK